MSDQHPPPPWSGQQAWNDPYQDLYQDTGRRSYQTEPGVWRSGPDAVPGYQRGVRSGANVMKRSAIGVVALAVLAAAWIITHRAHSPSTPVTATVTIPIINATWAPPPPRAAPAMTAEQVWQKFMQIGLASSIRVQLGLITQPMGPPSQCGVACESLPVQNGIAYRALNQLAYGYYWTACAAGTNVPATHCWHWLFLDANTGHLITGSNYNAPRGPAP